MPRYPGAQWHPVGNERPGGMTGYQFLVLHIMQGTLHGTDLWFHDPASRASSHFGVGKDGTVYQWVDTADRAWAQAAGNPVGISIEHEGSVPDALTDAQLAADAAILAWVHQVHGIPLQVTDDPVAGSGVCGHSTGAQQGWGHPFCPGQAILDQRQQIVGAATALLALAVVTAISPTGGGGAGGDTVTITGSGFTGATAVTFGSVPVTGLSVDSDTQITTTSPPPNASGAVDVTVSTASGTSATSPVDLFTYVTADAAPSVTGVSPASGAAAGGDNVTVTGSGFTGVTSVLFGDVPGTGLTVVSDSQLTVTSPAPDVSRTVDVVVYTGEAASAVTPADQFSYPDAAAPAVTGISPSTGDPAGGQPVVITGSGFTGATDVAFGSASAAAMTVDSDTQITATSAAGTSTVDVTVTTPAGISALGPADQYTYAAAG